MKRRSDTFQAYTRESEERIRARFERRYGRQPERVVEAGPVVLAGPLKREELGRGQRA